MNKSKKHLAKLYMSLKIIIILITVNNLYTFLGGRKVDCSLLLTSQNVTVNQQFNVLTEWWSLFQNTPYLLPDNSNFNSIEFVIYSRKVKKPLFNFFAGLGLVFYKAYVRRPTMCTSIYITLLNSTAVTCSRTGVVQSVWFWPYQYFGSLRFLSLFIYNNLSKDHELDKI